MEPTPNTLSENTGAQSVKLLNKNLAGGDGSVCPGDAAALERARRGFIAIHDLENYCDLIVERVDPLVASRATARSLFLEPLRHSANPYERPSA